MKSKELAADDAKPAQICSMWNHILFNKLQLPDTFAHSHSHFSEHITLVNVQEFTFVQVQ